MADAMTDIWWPQLFIMYDLIAMLNRTIEMGVVTDDVE